MDFWSAKYGNGGITDDGYESNLTIADSTNSQKCIYCYGCRKKLHIKNWSLSNNYSRCDICQLGRALDITGYVKKCAKCSKLLPGSEFKMDYRYLDCLRDVCIHCSSIKN